MKRVLFCVLAGLILTNICLGQDITERSDTTFVNISRSDETTSNSKVILEFAIEAGETIHTASSTRIGMTRIYLTVCYGYNYVDNFFAVGSGFGTSFKLIGNFGLNMELTYVPLFSIHSGLFDVVGFWRNSLIQFRPMFSYQFTKRLKIYAGPSLNILVQNNDDGGLFLLNPAIDVKIPYNLYNKTYENSTLNMWIGVVGGIKFILFPK